jgi:hypothetical protein
MKTILAISILTTLLAPTITSAEGRKYLWVMADKKLILKK